MPMGWVSWICETGSSQAWWAARRPYSIEVAASEGNPITSPTA